jgi:hypothetical protein
MGKSNLKCLDCTGRPREDHYGNEKYFHYSGFSEIESNGNLRLNISQGSEFSVAVAGHRDYSDEVHFRLSGNRLYIKSRHTWLNLGSDEDVPVVSITLPNLEQLHLKDRAYVQLSGLSGTELSIESAGYCELRGDLAFDVLDLDMAGAGIFQLKGHARELNVDMAGAAELKAGTFETEKVKIDMNGAGSASINASRSIKADLNGASKLTYKGDAAVTSSATGASIITKE